MTDLDDDDYGAPAPAGHNNPPPTFEEELRLENKDLFVRLDALKLSRDKLPTAIENDDQNAVVGRWVVQARELVKDVEVAHKEAKRPIQEKVTTIDTMFLSRGLAGEISKLVDVVKALADDYATRKDAERRKQLAEEAERKRLEAEAASYEAAALKEAGSNSAAEVVISQSEHADKQADRLEAKAAGSVAGVLRTSRGGVTASGREKWVFEIQDLDKIDLNILRDTFYAHELNQVIQRFVDGGGRELPGVRIFPKTIATFR